MHVIAYGVLDNTLVLWLPCMESLHVHRQFVAVYCHTQVSLIHHVARMIGVHGYCHGVAIDQEPLRQSAGVVIAYGEGYHDHQRAECWERR